MTDTSFFFTNFPDHFFAKDLWKVFQRWGRVLDVFISNKLNSRKRRSKCLFPGKEPGRYLDWYVEIIGELT